jgi:cell division initiation protein
MELTPLDLRNQSFKKKTLGGYDPEEVHAFLNQVAAEMERQGKQRTELHERIKIADERINYYKLIEKTLQDAAVTMQKTSDEARARAEKEAELIIAEAKARVTRETENMRTEVHDLKSEIATLKGQKLNFFIRFRSLIRSQEELLNAMEKPVPGLDDD